MREMGEGPAPPHTVPHGFWAGREISTLGHAGGWVREQGKARTRLSAGQRRLTSGQQVWGCQGSQDVHVPSQGSSSAQLREPRAGDGARHAGVRGPRPLQPQRGRAGALRASEGGGPSASAGHAEHAHGAPLCHPDQKQRPAQGPHAAAWGRAAALGARAVATGGSLSELIHTRGRCVRVGVYSVPVTAAGN